MIIKYTNFSDGIHKIILSKPASYLQLPEEFTGDVALNCEMDKSLSQIVLNCNIHMLGKFVCDRCNEEYDQNLQNEFQVICFLHRAENPNEELNIKYLPSEVDKINLNDDVREYSLLSIPMKKLCKTDCKGLCPYCGTNLNISKCSCKKEILNPVWDKLSKLKS